MDLQDKYNDLDNLIQNLGLAASEVHDKYYERQIQELIDEVNGELDAVSRDLREQKENELKEQLHEYWRNTIP